MVAPLTPVVVAARRTPVGTAGHALRDITVDRLAASALRAATDDLAVLDTGAVPDYVVLGNCTGPGGNLARYSALAAGLPTDTAAMTVDLQCGSGLAAITTAAALVRSGSATTVLAGGAESASTAPWRAWPPADEDAEPQRYTRAPFAPGEVGDPEMGVAADDLARSEGIDRERQDRYAVRSHERASSARAAGRFDAELVPVGDVGQDERIRDRLSVETLARLRPAFSPAGSVTAGNSCGISDGAAAIALVTESRRAALGLPGLRCVDWATSGVDSRLPGLGPVPAIRTLLSRNEIGWDDIGVVEVNEAFAAQVLACCDALGLDETRVCRDGGAIALGHPWGASGAILVVRLFSQLVREDGPRLGLASIAVGGGQGVALLVERVG